MICCSCYSWHVLLSFGVFFIVSQFEDWYQDAYKAAQRALFDDSLSLLMAGVEDAVKGIKAIAKDDEIQPQVRLRAYQIWLEQAIGLHKMSELESKVEELEQFLKDRSA